MERIPGLETFKRHAPEIETATALSGMVTMGAIAAVDSETREDLIESTDVSPFSMGKILDGTEKVGIADQAVFAALTIVFGAFAIHGISRIRNRRNPS